MLYCPVGAGAHEAFVSAVLRGPAAAHSTGVRMSHAALGLLPAHHCTLLAAEVFAVSFFSMGMLCLVRSPPQGMVVCLGAPYHACGLQPDTGSCRTAPVLRLFVGIVLTAAALAACVWWSSLVGGHLQALAVKQAHHRCGDVHVPVLKVLCSGVG